MTFDLQKILEDKRALRLDLASRPVAEKLRMLDALRQRALDIRRATVKPGDNKSAAQLLDRILAERRKLWSGRGKYKEPVGPNTADLPPLPESWVWCMSDALFSFITSGSRGWAAHYSETGPIFLRIGNLEHEDIRLDLAKLQHVTPPIGAEGSRTIVQADDILISITADVGMVGLVPIGLGEAYINQHIALARPLPSVCPSYVAYYLCAAEGGWGYFKKLQRGATKVGLGLDDIRAVPIPLAPLVEQRRIVTEIEKQLTRLETGIASLQRVQANLKRYRAAVLKAACEGRLVPTEAELHKTTADYETGEQLLARILTERRHNWRSRGKYKEPASPDNANPLLLPMGWVWSTVEQLSTMVQYGSSAKTSEDSTGIPVLRMGNIQNGTLTFDSLKYLPGEHSEFPELLLADGDLLFNRTNSPELVGKTAVFKGSPYPCSFASYLIRVRLAADCLPDFVCYFINSIFGRAWIARVVSQQVGQANVNGTKLQAFAVPLPPLLEQKRIVAEVERRLSVVEELEAVVTTNLQRAARLRQSILQRAFSGGLSSES